MIRRSIALISVAFVCLAAPSFAQDPSPDATPAHISFVDGPVILERDGRPDDSPGSMPLLAGDRIRTQGGRAEILFADGSALHVDTHTVVDFQSDEVVRLLEGRIRLSIAGQARGLAYRVDAPGGWVDIAESGEYRIAVLRDQGAPQVELAVLRGGAELVNENGRSFVRAGERAFARADAQPSAPYVFNSAAWDAFDRWSEARRDQRLGISAEYLPSDVRPYSAAFDTYGYWRHEPVYGRVWYPRVHAGWRPYYHGRWVSLRPYGWTWISADPWGWPTHHYGRWGFSSGAWFWIPGRRWGAAWVSWAHAPGYISWCPLGWNDRPVFSFININIFGGRRYDRWHGWSVVPRRHFATGFVNVHRVVSPHRFDSRIHRSFVVRDRGPEGYAVPRASTAIRRAGIRTGYAVPRGSANSVSASQSPRITSPGSRSFPSPARAPRSVDSIRGSADRASRPTTPAPPRAVPRDRGADRDRGVSSVDRSRVSSDRSRVSSPDRTDRVTVPGSRVAPQRRESPDAGRRESPDTGRRESPAAGRRVDPSPTPPPSGSRAVPRRSPGGESQSRRESDWRRYDRPDSIPAPRRAPEYRTDPGTRPEAGYGRIPDGGRSTDRYRAVPRQDVPRPSIVTPRAERPRSYRAPDGGSAPRSYGSPGGGSAPRSYRAPESRPPSSSPPRAERPSRSAPSGDSGGSRSRGDQPSRGQARPRGGGPR